MSFPDFSITALVVLLFLAVMTDLKDHRIPNSLTINFAVIAIILSAIQSGLDGLMASVAGLFIGFFLLLPFYLVQGMRGGDLKLMAAAGAFLGINTFLAVGLSLIIGSVLGILVLLWRKGGIAYFKRYWSILVFYFHTGMLQYQSPDSNEAAATSFPYALAIACGSLATLFLV